MRNEGERLIRIFSTEQEKVEEILVREDPMQGVDLTVQKIILDVRENGDEALFRYSKEFDQVELAAVEVSPGEIEYGFRQADPQLVEILYMAAERIYAFHRKQLCHGFQISEEPGIILGQKVLPLERVGIYG